MTTLRDIVSAQSLMAEELPLVHTTPLRNFASILGSNELRSDQPCDVFNEPLVYFFYGRPAYQCAFNTDVPDLEMLFPLCFVFRPHTMGYLTKRVYACDSGGIQKGYFNRHLKSSDRDEMELAPSLESARKLVHLRYGDNSRYYVGNAKPNLPTLFPDGSAAARFHALLNDRTPGAGAGDDRRSAIEVQMSSPVALEHRLLYLYLPNTQLGIPAVRKAIFETWQAEPRGYETVQARPPNEFRSVIGELLLELYREGSRL